jgi:hypothetical protein
LFQLGLLEKVLWQTPKLHTRPELQLSPPQHACPWKPQPENPLVPLLKPQFQLFVFVPNPVLGGSHKHTPNVHVVPIPHRNPRQQPWNIPPHASVAVDWNWHVPLRHSLPVAHAFPAQHAWPVPPQPLGRPHWPPTQLSPVAHVVPAQHGCVSAPHAPTALP